MIIFIFTPTYQPDHRAMVSREMQACNMEQPSTLPAKLLCKLCVAPVRYVIHAKDKAELECVLCSHDMYLSQALVLLGGSIHHTAGEGRGGVTGRHTTVTFATNTHHNINTEGPRLVHSWLYSLWHTMHRVTELHCVASGVSLVMGVDHSGRGRWYLAVWRRTGPEVGSVPALVTPSLRSLQGIKIWFPFAVFIIIRHGSYTQQYCQSCAHSTGDSFTLAYLCSLVCLLLPRASNVSDYFIPMLCSRRLAPIYVK